MKKLFLILALLMQSLVAWADEVTLTDVPVSFYGQVVGKLNGTELPLHFGALQLRMTPRKQSATALNRSLDLVKLDAGDVAFSYQMDVPFHQFLDVVAPTYYRQDELSSSLPIGGTEQPLDVSEIQFVYNGVTYSAAVREPYVPTYEFISSQRADVVRMDFVVNLPASLAKDETFAQALYEAFLAGLANDATNKGKNEDYDGDGVNNFDEILTGLDPLINETRPRLLGDATRLRHVAVLDSVWRPFWMPIEDSNTAADKVFIRLDELPTWLEIRQDDSGSPVNNSDVLTLDDFQSGRIWARAKPGTADTVQSGLVKLALGENSESGITTESHELTVKRLPLSRQDGLDSKVWLRADASVGGDGLVSGLSGHAHDRWKGNWQSYDVVVSDQDNQQLMELSSSGYMALSNPEQHWRALGEQSTSILVANLNASVADQALFSDGFNVVTRYSAAHPQYPKHIVVEQPTAGKRWVSQAPVSDDWHVITLETPASGQARLWIDGVYAASRAISTTPALVSPYPAVGGWFELDRNGSPVIRMANGLAVGEFLGYDRLLDKGTLDAQAAYLLAKWKGMVWVDRLGALSAQVASTVDKDSYFVSGGRSNTFTGGAGRDVFLALDGTSTLKGNQGADRFVVGVGTVIEDFSPEQGDTVDLSAILSDVPDATNWFDVLDVVADAGTGSTVLQVHPQGVGKTTTANIRKVTLKGKSLSKQDLLDLWRSRSLVAGRFRPETQLSLKALGDSALSEQKTNKRMIEVVRTGSGLPKGSRLPLMLSGTAVAEDYLAEFQSVGALPGEAYLNMSKPENAAQLAALNGELRLRFSAMPDVVSEPAESLLATLLPMPEWYDLQESSSVSTTLTDGADVITIAVDTTSISENAESQKPVQALVTLQRSGAIDKALDVKIQILGNAENGTDYDYLSESVHFQVGSATAALWVKVKADRLVENNEAVEIVLLPQDGYETGVPDRVKIDIYDASQKVSLRALESVTTTGDSLRATVAIERTGIAQGEMLVDLELGGTAKNGVDYQYLSPFLSFSDVQTTKLLSITPITAGETSLKYVDVSLKASSQYTLGSPTAQRVYLVSSLTSDEDNDGMPDVWEIHNRLNPLLAGNHVDSDGDGLRDGDEYKFGSDPNSRDTDGDGSVDGDDAFPTDKTRDKFADMFTSRISFEPDHARSMSIQTLRVKALIGSDMVTSKGITLRLYYDASRVALVTPAFPASLGLVSSHDKIQDVDNKDGNAETTAYSEWTFFLPSENWYQTLAAAGGSLNFQFNWLAAAKDGAKVPVNAYVVPNGDATTWHYAGALLELVEPALLDISADGNVVSEDDVWMTLAGLLDQDNSLIKDALAGGGLESSMSESGDRVRALAGKLDIDGNGVESLYSDGLLIARYKVGLRGNSLIKDAVAANASRTSAAEIEAYLSVMFGGI